jgi:hypothetical protein
LRVTRRELLRGAGSFVGAVLLGDRVKGAARRRHSRRRRIGRSRIERATPHLDAGPLSGTKLFEDVVTYYNLGEHRTGTEVDLRTSQWLAGQLSVAGLKTTFQSFGLRQFFVRETRLTVGDRRFRAFPLWFPRGTGPSPVKAVLAEFDKRAERQSLRGKIALVRFPSGASSTAIGSGHAEIIHGAARAEAAAVVAVTEGATKEIIALNQPAGAEPWPLPVILVGQRDESVLTAAARSGAGASLIVDGNDDHEATARNVIARLDGGKDVIVVSTPQSGWFRCAAERGPGIALFLGLARWARSRQSGSSFLFVSTSGHELGGLGMRAFMKELAPPPGRVLCWLHLGSGIAAFSWEETAMGLRRLREPDSKRYLMTSPDLVPILTTAFAGQPGLTPAVGRAVGEFEFMIKAGYRTFGIAAAHRFHHTPADSPEMTGSEILEPVGRALINTIEAIESSGVRN